MVLSLKNFTLSKPTVTETQDTSELLFPDKSSGADACFFQL